jgi:hypothetical protein
MNQINKTNQINQTDRAVQDAQASKVLLCRNDYSAPSQSLPSFSARSIPIQEVIGFDLRE